MEYIKKTCPVCGKEFLVLESVEEKAVYCTLECLIRASGDLGKDPEILLSCSNNSVIG